MILHGCPWLGLQVNSSLCGVALTFEATVSDKKDLQITLEIKKNTFQLQRVLFFSKICISLTEKQLLIGLNSVGTGRCFRKIPLNFGMKFLVFLPIKAIKIHKTTWQWLLYNCLTKVSITMPHGKMHPYENQNLNDLLLETMAWIDFSWRELIPNNKELPVFSQNMLFLQELLYL